MKRLISVNMTKCNNCLACISVCPVKTCIDGSGSIVDVIAERCLGCGNCIPVCYQKARAFDDDTERFFLDLSNGIPITAIIDPSAAALFADINLLIAFLESQGVRAVFDASFGAELTVKSYLEYIKEKKPATLISSVCPAIVTYCEIYKPELLQYLAPIQSPVLHTAKMIKEFFPEYKNNSLASISPCAAKAREYAAEGFIEYNVSMIMLKKYMKKFDFSSLKRKDFNGPVAERAVGFSSPGGFTDVINREGNPIKTSRRIEGSDVYAYLNQLPLMIEKGCAPDFIDCLSCAWGCNVGPGSGANNSTAVLLESKINKRKEEHLKNKSDDFENNINKYWKKDIYTRSFKDTSGVLSQIRKPNINELNKIYFKMRKFCHSNMINCSACGYGSCYAMAVAIFNNLQKPENCHHYLRLISSENEKLLEKETIKANLASEEKTRFLATMSHEIRTPLNAILGFAEIVLNKNPSNDIEMDVNNIYNSGKNLLAIVNDILDISKIEAGNFELISVTYDVARIISDSINSNIVRIKSEPIEFRLNIEKNVPKELLGDELRVKQILNNLLSNAFKYTKQGSVDLNISFSEENYKTFLHFTVIDTGIGIRDKDTSKLFGEYHQLDKRANREIEGTGLGLAITKRIVEKMNGVISVESVFNKGSTFKVRIEQTQVGKDCIDEKTITELKTYNFVNTANKNFEINKIINNGRALVVDDVQTNLDVTKGILMRYKLLVDCVRSGKEAIKLIEEQKYIYDIVFLDHMMPEMDGIETIQIIRKKIDSEYAKTVPIVALTADAIAGSREMYLNAGFNDYISKPIDIMLLDKVLNKYMSNKFQNVPVYDFINNASLNTVEDKINSTIDIDGFDWNEGLQRFGNQEDYLEILKSYVETTPDLLNNIQAVSSETLPNYAITVHGIKSTCKSIGAFAAGKKAEELEYAAKERRLDFVLKENPAFLKMTYKLISELTDIINNYSSNQEKPKKESPDAGTINSLFNACTNYDMQNIDAYIEELEKYDYKYGADLILELRKHLNMSNFEAVTERIKKYMEELNETKE
ncbi:hypothetical protein FACS1894190_09140 [Spirochaetia bacterium]|nr:hypothetical protein FACS1894190_09140 [Spirochaetia bacterium]